MPPACLSHCLLDKASQDSFLRRLVYHQRTDEKRKKEPCPPTMTRHHPLLITIRDDMVSQIRHSAKRASKMARILTCWPCAALPPGQRAQGLPFRLTTGLVTTWTLPQNSAGEHRHWSMEPALHQSIPAWPASAIHEHFLNVSRRICGGPAPDSKHPRIFSSAARWLSSVAAE